MTPPGQLLDEQNDKTQSTPRTLESSVRVRLLRLGRLLSREGRALYATMSILDRFRRRRAASEAFFRRFTDGFM